MQTDPEARSRGRRSLLLLMALFAAPVLAATAWYVFAPDLAPRASAHGTLIRPAQPMEPFEVARSGGGSFTLDELHGHWTLIHAIGRDCPQACRERLHDTRQIHDALGEDRIRVRRLALAADGRGTRGLSEVLSTHPRLTVLTQDSDGALARQLPAAPAGTVFLVDPLGNLMMRFGPEAEARGILDDLERLLKNSQVG